MWMPGGLYKAIRYSSVWCECRYLIGSTRGSFILSVEPGLQGLNVDYLSTRQIICFGILSVDPGLQGD